MVGGAPLAFSDFWGAIRSDGVRVSLTACGP